MRLGPQLSAEYCSAGLRGLIGAVALAGLFGVACTPEPVVCGAPPERVQGPADGGTANPTANADTRKLLTWLQSLPSRPDRRVLAGQQVGAANFRLQEGHDDCVEGLNRATGKYPALVGFDLGYGKLGSPEQLEAVHVMARDDAAHGAVIEIDMSLGNPQTGGNVDDLAFTAMKDLAVPGSKTELAWRAQLDQVAGLLAKLRDDGVPVLFRPFHEMNIGAFWWSRQGRSDAVCPEDFVAAWRALFTQLSDERGLDNLLWVYAPNMAFDDAAKPVDFYFPGSAFVDVSGVDFYSRNIDDLAVRDGYQTASALSAVFGLTEYGPTATGAARGDFDMTGVLDGIKTRFPRTTFFMNWSSWNNITGPHLMCIVQNQKAAELMSDPWIISRDEVNWR